MPSILFIISVLRRQKQSLAFNTYYPCQFEYIVLPLGNADSASVKMSINMPVSKMCCEDTMIGYIKDLDWLLAHCMTSINDNLNSFCVLYS